MKAGRGTSHDIEAALHAWAVENPYWSIRRIHRAALRTGIDVSYSTVHKLLTKNLVSVMTLKLNYDFLRTIPKRKMNSE